MSLTVTVGKSAVFRVILCGRLVSLMLETRPSNLLVVSLLN